MRPLLLRVCIVTASTWALLALLGQQWVPNMDLLVEIDSYLTRFVLPWVSLLAIRDFGVG